MFTFIGHIASSLLWGGLLALLLLVIVQFIIKVVFSPYAYSPSSIAVISVAFCMLMWQTVSMIGAFYLKGYVETLEEMVQNILPDDGSVISADQMHQLDRQLDDMQGILGDKFTINIKEYLAQLTVGDRIDKTQVVHSVSEEFLSGVNWFIWKRVFWIIGIVVVSIVAAGLLGNQGTGGGGKSSRRRSGRNVAHAGVAHSSSRRRRNRV